MKTLQHKFVEFIPEKLEAEVLYVTIAYRTAAHLCVCGCGNKVVTPISPTDWKLTFDGKTVSLYPSIGSWNLECKSHYFITNNEVKWAMSWPKKEVDNKIEQKNCYSFSTF